MIFAKLPPGLGLVLALSLAACGGTRTLPEPEAPATADSSVSREQAQELAADAALAEGYDVTEYQLEEMTLDEGGDWWLRYVLPPPTPPGGHFGVVVDAETGQARVMHGE